jgi:hypothetical protein
MSLSETSLKEQTNPMIPSEDIFDDGFLRVEHQNYYVACGGTPVETASHRVSDLLAAGADS